MKRLGYYCGFALGALLLLSLSGCLADKDKVTPEKSIDTPTVWEAGKRVELQSTLRVNAKLTIEEGVELQCASGAGIVVGENSSSACIIIHGTAARPVILRGTPSDGGWRGLEIKNENTASRIEHCQLLGVRNTPDRGAALKILKSTFPVRNVRVNDCAGHGIWVQYAGEGSISNCQVTTREGHALVIPASLLTGMLGGGIASESDAYGVLLKGGTAEGPLTIDGQGFPDIFVGESVILEGGTIDLQNAYFRCLPGASVEFACVKKTLLRVNNCRFVSAKSDREGKLMERGLWQGVKIYDNLESGSFFNGNRVCQGGGKPQKGGLEIHAPSLELKTNTFYWNAGYGLVYYGTNSGVGQEVSNNTFAGNELGDSDNSRGGVE